MTNRVERLIDANLNRLREGIRVIEDINRYIYNNKTLTPKLKSIRHAVAKGYDTKRLQHRDILGDIQKKSIDTELARSSIEDIVIANFSRATESARVLEESFKLGNIELSEHFKQIRYELYEVERLFFASTNSTSNSK
ncbi:MAG: thiamine-phosphate pyrophosphorylase [Campylobacterota bacterium]|nr:thiamine-phosphate pyrophosphorylase [Campylobacterota bacterium]